MTELDDMIGTRRFESVVSPAFRLDGQDVHNMAPIVNLMAFALPVGNGDHYVLSPNARTFHDLNIMGAGIEERSAFEIAVGFAENHKLGTPFLKRGIVEGPHTYEYLLEMITTRDGKPNTSAYENASSASRGSTQYNPRVAFRYGELLQTRESRHTLVPPGTSGTGDATMNNSGGAVRDDAPRHLPRTRDERGDVHLDLGALMAHSAAINDNSAEASTRRQRTLKAELNEGHAGWAETIANDTDNAMTGHDASESTRNDNEDEESLWAELAPAPPRQGNAENAENAGTDTDQRGQRMQRGRLEELPPNDSSMMAFERTVAMTRSAFSNAYHQESGLDELCNKWTILFIAFYDHTHQDSTGKAVLDGALMLMLAHDPLLNPGVDILEKEANLRKLKQMSSTRTSTFGTDTTLSDLQFRYSNLPSQNILHYLDQDHYRNLCQAYVGSSTPLPKDERDVSLLDHAAHPFRIFTLDRALERLRTTGQGPVDEYLAPLERLQAHLDMQADRPFMEVGSVLSQVPELYQMDQRDCQWYSRSGTGLAVQFLPWEDGMIRLRTEPEDPEPIARAIELLATTSQGLGALGRTNTANPAISDADDPREGARIDNDGSAIAPAHLPANQRDAIERQIKQFRFSTHAASYDAIQGSVLEVRRSQVNWIVAMGERYAQVRAAFEQAMPSVPGGDAATTRPSLQQLTKWTAERRRACHVMNDYRQAGMRMFEGVLWKPDSITPPCLNAIIRWHFSGGPNGAPGFRNVSAPIKINNRFCDLFGNAMLYDALFARYKKRNINGLQVVMLKPFTYNAYYSNGKMSNGKMATGPAGVGKSYEQEELMWLLISGSYIVVMSETSFANLSNSDNSDHITLYDEMPYHIVSSGKANDKNGQGARTKSMLTTGQDARRTVEMVKTASGVQKRITRIVRSWQEGVTLIASNISVKDIDPAIVSRFLHEIYADVAGDEEFLARREQETRDTRANSTPEAVAGQSRKAPSIIELRTGQMSSFEDREMAAYVKRHRIEQTLVAAYYKLLQAGVLPEVTMTACDLLIGKVLIVLREMGIRTGNYRKYERVHNTAHASTVMNALSCAYHNQYGGDWRNKEFRIPDLNFIVPYLFCTKQIALFAFTSLLSDFINSMQGPIIRGLYEMARFPLVRYRELMESDEVDNAIEVIAITNTHVSWRQLDEDYVDPNYIAFRGTYYDVARQLGGHMKIKPSVDDIVSMLHELSTTLITFDAVDKLPVEEIHAGAGSSLTTAGLARTPRQTMPAVIQERAARGGGFVVCLCVQAFRLIRASDLVLKALAKLVYRGMTPQTFVLGTMSGDNATRGAFDTFEVTREMCEAPGVDEAFTMRSGDYMEDDQLHQLFNPFHSLNPDDYNEKGELVRGALYAAHDASRQAASYDVEQEQEREINALFGNVHDPDEQPDSQEEEEDSSEEQEKDEDSSDEEDEREAGYGGEEDEEEDAEEYSEEARMAAEFCSPVPNDYKSAFKAIAEHLNQGRMQDHIVIREDLDQYSAFLHFQRTGLLLKPHSDPAVASDTTLPLSARVQWAYTDPITGEERLRPLPTSQHIIEKVDSGLRSHGTAAAQYNQCYARSPADVRTKHMLPVPEPRQTSRTIRRKKTKNPKNPKNLKNPKNPKNPKTTKPTNDRDVARSRMQRRARLGSSIGPRSVSRSTTTITEADRPSTTSVTENTTTPTATTSARKRRRSGARPAKNARPSKRVHTHPVTDTTNVSPQ